MVLVLLNLDLGLSFKLHSFMFILVKRKYHQQHCVCCWQPVCAAQTSCSLSTHPAASDSRTLNRWHDFLNCLSTPWTWMQTTPITQSAALECLHTPTQRPFTSSWILSVSEPKYFRRSMYDIVVERQMQLMQSGVYSFHFYTPNTLYITFCPLSFVVHYL